MGQTQPQRDKGTVAAAPVALRIGLEISGLKLRAIGLEPNGEVVFQRETLTPRGSYQALVSAVRDLYRLVTKEWGALSQVGIAIPGTLVHASGLIKNANITELNGSALPADLEAALGCTVRLANDANCFALAEAMDGAAAGCGVVFGVILDHGCGGGLVVHGRKVGGRNGLAGEWGHNTLPHPRASDLPQLACYCGQYGCIETYVSAPGFTHDYALLSGTARSVSDIAAAAAAGDQDAVAACERLEDRLARSLAGVINILDPDRIVVGGQLADLTRIYEHVPRLWRQYVFGNEADTQLVPTQHGETSTVRGAAWLWELPQGR